MEIWDFRPLGPFLFSGNNKILEAHIPRVLKMQVEFYLLAGQWEPYRAARLNCSHYEMKEIVNCM